MEILRPGEQAELLVFARDLSIANDWMSQQTSSIDAIRFHVDPDCLNVTETCKKTIERICLEHLTELKFYDTPSVGCNNDKDQRAIFYLKGDVIYRLEWHWRPDNGRKIFTMRVHNVIDVR